MDGGSYGGTNWHCTSPMDGYQLTQSVDINLHSQWISPYRALQDEDNVQFLQKFLAHDQIINCDRKWCSLAFWDPRSTPDTLDEWGKALDVDFVICGDCDDLHSPQTLKVPSLLSFPFFFLIFRKIGGLQTLLYTCLARQVPMSVCGYQVDIHPNIEPLKYCTSIVPSRHRQPPASQAKPTVNIAQMSHPGDRPIAPLSRWKRAHNVSMVKSLSQARSII